MIFILKSIAPIFILIALGYFIHHSKRVSESFFSELNSLIFRYAAPALIIDRISTSQFNLDAVSRTFLIIALCILLSALVGGLTASALRLPREQKGVFIQGAFRGNTVFIGLPLISFALGEQCPEAESLATVIFGPIVIILNVLSIALLVHYSNTKDAHAPKTPIKTILELFKNPLILACLIGLFLQFTHIALPSPLARTLSILGKTAFPFALLGIGAGLTFNSLKQVSTTAFAASFIKLAFAPLLGFLLAPLFGLTPVERLVAILLLACPTAINSYVMAEAMNNDAPLAGRIVVLSTLLSTLTLPIILAIGMIP